MIEKLRGFCQKHREILVYLIVGGLTTLVSWGAKFLWNFAFYGGTAHPGSLQNTVLSVVEWLAGVAFAYPANRRWVFRSKNPNIPAEAAGFVGSRLATLGLNWALMQLTVNVLSWNFYLATVLAGAAVVVGNYVLSKLLIFRRKKGE